MEFWNDIATDRSWEVLIRLKKEFDFVLIGGWAIYLYTKTLKSKDIDIITDFEALDNIKNRYRLKKTAFLRKYEIAVEGISVDIYVPFYSKLAVPTNIILKNSVTREGFRLPSPETLLVLKQQAERDRRDSVKGQKDRVDILSLLLKGGVNLDKYSALLKELSLQDYKKQLKETITAARKEFAYLGITDPRKIKLWKRELLEKLA
ncbi:MAG: hypothetical protein ISS93_02975 [Candidatus Aenigmarchaeota archaeon]|nr:hypothetical protein [Candidatus Aenigmarchaeota archaeon]